MNVIIVGVDEFGDVATAATDRTKIKAYAAIPERVVEVGTNTLAEAFELDIPAVYDISTVDGEAAANAMLSRVQSRQTNRIYRFLEAEITVNLTGGLL